MIQINNATNMSHSGIQVFIGQDKEEGNVLVIRNNGSGGKLAGKTNYECAIPIGKIGIAEELFNRARAANGIKSFAEIEADEKLNEEMNERVAVVWAELELRGNKALLNTLRDIRDQIPGDKQGRLIKMDIDCASVLKSKGVIDALLKDPDTGEITHWSDNAKDYCFTEFGLHIEGLLRDKDGIARNT